MVVPITKSLSNNTQTALAAVVNKFGSSCLLPTCAIACSSAAGGQAIISMTLRETLLFGGMATIGLLFPGMLLVLATMSVHELSVLFPRFSASAMGRKTTFQHIHGRRMQATAVSIMPL